MGKELVGNRLDLEGRCCELARFGYSRDSKNGKLQIVYGLLCAADGCPLAVEVFEGNTADHMTLAPQVDKLKHFDSATKNLNPIGLEHLQDGPRSATRPSVGSVAGEPSKIAAHRAWRRLESFLRECPNHHRIICLVGEAVPLRVKQVPLSSLGT